MTYFKKKTSSVQTDRPKPLLESFAILFYVCKICGINSQDWREFRKYKHLVKSPGGEGLVIIGIIIIFINYNLMIGVFQTGAFIEEKNLLTVSIGFVLMYFSLVLVMSDRINSLRKQEDFVNIFNDLEEIDEDLRDLNIVINNNFIKYRLILGMIIPAVLEIVTFTLSFVMYVDPADWTAWLWIFTNVPTYLNTLDKLWYLGVVAAIKSRFEAINQAFDEAALSLEQEKQKLESHKPIKKSKKQKKTKYYTFKNQIRPAITNFQGVFGDVVKEPELLLESFDDTLTSISPNRFSISSSDSSCSTNIIYPSLEERFIKLCQLHDTLCNVGKQLNEVYAFPILILMGFGFFIITAQLYYFYCTQADQIIPSIFRSAENWWITGMYIFYVSSKCISILFVNWKTNLESKKTGICIHRCALAADTNEKYEMINHLSLKLFNHPLDFNACGYFSLNMSTLFGFCGGITTYLIILIQFNLEEQQVKSKTIENGQTAALKVYNDNVGEEYVVNGTRFDNATSLMGLFQRLWSDYIENV